MEQIISNNSGVLIQELSLLKNNADSKNTFLALIKKDVVDLNGNRWVQPVQANNHQVLDGIEKSSVNFNDLKVDGIKFHHLTDSSHIEQQKKSELYEQKWFSIGKLSYIDSDKNLRVEVNQSLQNAIFTAKDIRISGTDERVNSIGMEKLQQASINITNSQTQQDRLIQKNVMELSKLITQVQNTHDIEKKKLSLIKDKESVTLVIRDYHTNQHDIFGHLKNLLHLAKSTISKVILNGKAVK
jgi:hypothetical protein